MNTESAKKGRPAALVTGGSKGIGLGLAREFAAHGHDLVLVARDEAMLQQAAGELRREHPGTVTTLCLDLGEKGAAAELHRRCREQGIEVGILVNNAGIGDYGPFVQSDPERLERMLSLNVIALTEITRMFLPRMIERGSGRILNVASLVAFFSGGPHWVSYVASKHYVLAFSRGLAKELSGSGVTVTALCPGATATEFVDTAGAGGARVYRWLPAVSVADVAHAGYRAAMSGRRVVVPGLLNKVFAFLGELPPRAIAQQVFAFLSASG